MSTHAGPALAALVAAASPHLLPSIVARLSATCRAYRAELRPLLISRRADLSGGAEPHPVPLLAPCDGPTAQPNFLYLRSSAGCDVRMRRRLALVEAAPCSCAPGACVAGSCTCIGAGREAVDEQGRLRYLLEEFPTTHVEPPIVECSVRCACCAPADHSPTDTLDGVGMDGPTACVNVPRSRGWVNAAGRGSVNSPASRLIAPISCPCLNAPTSHGLRLRLAVFATRDRGYGLRTLQHVPKGTFVCEYAGEYVTSAQAAERRGAQGIGAANYAVCVREHVAGGRVLRTWIDPTVRAMKIARRAPSRAKL
jgi:hypothetical protein